MSDSNSPARLEAHRNRLIFWRLVLLACAVGLAVGFWEAGLLFYVPSVRQYLRVDIAWVIWFLAPLIDLGFFALLGVILGLIAIAGSGGSSRRQIGLAAVLLGVAGAMIGWSQHFVHTHAVNMQVYSSCKGLLFPAIRFAAVLVLALIVASVWRGPFSRLFSPECRWPLRNLGLAIAAAALILGAGVISYTAMQSVSSPRIAAADPARGMPNIILITMDTTRADHLSVYGYARKTTPNIDRFAQSGVLFENTISAAPWTLPSLASIFSGLLPHQNGANTFRPANPGWESLGDVLRSYGYSTAAFNANDFYGQSGWGIADGFRTYNSADGTLRYNLARTLLGRVAVQPAYQDFGRYDAFFRRDAGDLNTDIFGWLGGRPPEPYFLYINYFDAHGPYFSPSPFDHRFGSVPSSVLRKIGFAGLKRVSGRLPDSEQQELISGYDDCVAYMDSQIGRLLGRLKKSPDWPNTIVIITADHGEAFGEHGFYQHANDVHWEEIHVPLIIAGPGIPAGRRIEPPVSLRSLYSTVLDLGLGGRVPMHAFSLSRYWEHPSTEQVPDEQIVSELSSSLKYPGGELSLVTPEWHYIRTGHGQQELYRWTSDSGEQQDLSSLPQNKAVLTELNNQLQQVIEYSTEPWLGREYLSALGEPAVPITALNRTGRSTAPEPEKIGAAQAYFHPDVSTPSQRPNQPENDLLKSLPYQ